MRVYACAPMHEWLAYMPMLRSMHACVCMFIPVHGHLHMCKYACALAHVHLCLCTYTCASIHVHLCMCTAGEDRAAGSASRASQPDSTIAEQVGALIDWLIG